MTGTQRVPSPSSRLTGHEGAVASAVLIAILVAIAKPWGAGPGDTDSSRPAFASPSKSAEPGPSVAGHVFDPNLYGPFEPAPDWSIWPAGYFVTVLFVTRASNADAQLSPIATAGPSSRPGIGSPRPAASSSATAGPNWPSTIEVGPGDHLLWLGINTPRGWSVRGAVLRRIQPHGAATVVPTTRLPSLWDDHFTVLAIPTSSSSTTLAVWPSGDYRLDLTVSPGNIERTIVIHVGTADVAVPQRAPDRG